MRLSFPPLLQIAAAATGGSVVLGSMIGVAIGSYATSGMTAFSYDGYAMPDRGTETAATQTAPAENAPALPMVAADVESGDTIIGEDALYDGSDALSRDGYDSRDDGYADDGSSRSDSVY